MRKAKSNIMSRQFALWNKKKSSNNNKLPIGYEMKTVGENV